jgi:Protein of unknown function C-terminus (DUF2399)
MSKLSDALSLDLARLTAEFTKEKRHAYSYRTEYISQEQIAKLRKREAEAELKQLLKPVAYRVMEQAYMVASGNGTLPANARQIMYAARPLVLNITGGKSWTKSSYFTQVLLPDYVNEHPDETEDWDVVYDARGHLAEPHVRYRLGIGTLEVRSYINSWHSNVSRRPYIELETLYPTRGPANRFKFALFVEKEGFDHLLDRAQIANRYDIAIFSTKGVSNTAARRLVERLSDHGVTVLVAHDFDLAGLTITHTLGHDTRRYRFETEPNVLDIGLRLNDIKGMALQSEPVLIKQKKNPRDKFRGRDFNYDEYDVTEEELQFLVEQQLETKLWQGKRVELNAMPAPQFIQWLESKLQQHGVEKVIPDDQTLEAAYRRAERIAKIQALIDEAEQAKDDSIEIPDNLAERVQELFKTHPALSWDQALLQIGK